MERLKKEKAIREAKAKLIELDCYNRGYSAEFSNERKQDEDNAIREIENRIEALSQSTNFEKDLERLPEIFDKILELAGRTISKAENETLESDITKLIQLIKPKLPVYNEKELKVELSIETKN